MSVPSPNGSNGRNKQNGRFVKGWKGGPGNPYAKNANKFRAAVMDQVTEQGIADVWETLQCAAVAGEPWAVTLFLRYTIGEPAAMVDIPEETSDELSLAQLAPRLANKVALELLIQQDER